MSTLDAHSSTEVNRLYWETDESVADISARLGISRRALYDALEPLPVDQPCDVCGAPLTFENRSARAAGTAFCAICAEAGFITEEQAVDAVSDPSAGSVFGDAEEAALRIGPAALAGAALGALVTFALVPRR